MKLKVFVSSTCYDLGIVRAQLRSFLEGMGYEPVMSEYDDVLYDPQNHTHASCVNAISKCDMVILLIGSRFGGEVVPSVLSELDFDMLSTKSSKNQMLDKGKFSITQCEILKAIQSNIPIYTFILDQVLSDHRFYEKNKKEKELMKKAKFPSIEKNEHAPYIFEFINFMRARSENNSYMSFSKIEDIENCLKKQWSGLFQSLLEKGRDMKDKMEQTQILSNQIEELKAMLMSTVEAGDMKEAAKGVPKYRTLVSIIDSITSQNSIIFDNIRWKELLVHCEIVELKMIHFRSFLVNEIVFVKKDMSYCSVRALNYDIGRLKQLWEEFVKLKESIKKAVVEAIRDMGVDYVKSRGENVDEYIDSRVEDGKVLSISTESRL